MDYPERTSAKIELREAGWTYNRKRRQWEYGNPPLLTAPSLSEALYLHRRVRRISDMES